MKSSRRKNVAAMSPSPDPQAASGEDAEALLKSDHRKVEQLFQQYETAGESQKKSEIARQICLELVVHTKLEEEIFYPACREKENEDEEPLDEAQIEHDSAKVLIAELMHGSPNDEFFDAKVKVLSEYIKHHVGEEEKPRDGILAKARKAGVDMNALGTKIQARKQELLAMSDALGSRPPRPVSLNPTVGRQTGQEDDTMPRYYERDRDERGRFTDDDDRGYSSRSRDYDDDERYSSRGRGHGGWYGDPEGHSEAAERRGYSSRSRYDDDDDYRSGGRGRRHGGWFGDPEGHSEASERGHRGSSRSRYEDDDDDRRGSRGRGHGGWFGDSEGHSEASERGWESRGHRGSSRSRYEDDDYDDRRRSHGGHGGWFGDPRGHSQAARRGWDDR